MAEDREEAAGHVVDTARPLAGAGGGLPAFAVRARADLMAVQTRPSRPARADVIAALHNTSIAGVLVPRTISRATLGDGRKSLFVVGAAPPGPSLSSLPGRPWSDAELIDGVLRPAAAALDTLHARRVTHRAIRPDNVFRTGSDGRVVLGCFWAAPPASLQPALFEPPYSAMCQPCGRGAGSIADDVYALGVLLLVLALGRLPLAELNDRALIRRKLEHGSFQALTGDERLSSAVADLLRGMLAEDPEHRPSPAMLLDPSAARTRRVAARPPRRAQRALEIGGDTIWDARSLAFALVNDTAHDQHSLRGAVIEHWLRRSLGDVALANRVEGAMRPAAEAGPAGRADRHRLMRIVAALDPLAPLCWQGLAFWPDGLGALLASEATPELEEIVDGEIIAVWAEERPERCDLSGTRIDARRFRAMLRRAGWTGGVARLRYELNPVLACRSALIEAEAVAGLRDLLPALEVRAPAAPGGPRPVDREIVAFVVSRAEGVLDSAAAVNGQGAEPDVTLAGLRMLAQLQERLHAGESFPRLAAWIGAGSAAILGSWRNRERRQRLAQALSAVTASGQLPAMLALLDDPGERARDERDANQAIETMRAIDAELQRQAEEAPVRAQLAERIGAEIASATAGFALAAALLVALLR